MIKLLFKLIDETYLDAWLHNPSTLVWSVEGWRLFFSAVSACVRTAAETLQTPRDDVIGTINLHVTQK